MRNYDMLKTQCYFKLAEYVNSWKIKISVNDSDFKEKLIEELDIIVEIGLEKDAKISIIKKDAIIQKLGRSPDYADMVMMRMFYELYNAPDVTQEKQEEVNFNPFHTLSNEDKTLDEIIFWDDDYNEEDDFNDNPFN